MKEKIIDLIRFLNDHIIECDPSDGCGRCNEARIHVSNLIEILRDIEFAELDNIELHPDND